MDHTPVLNDFFHWIPPQDRPTRFGPPVPNRPVEHRRPLLWITRKDCGLYLVNDTGEMLEWVIASPGGFTTIDDTPVALNQGCHISDGDSTTAGKDTSAKEGCRSYRNVAPRAAVLLDTYDLILDSDYMLTVTVRVKSPSLGLLEFTPVPERGGLAETVLLWENDDHNRSIEIKRLKQSL